MYRHVLIGIDGSAFALKAALHGLNLAKSISAMASAIIVTPTWEAIALSEIAQGHFQDEYDARTKEYAERCLGKVRAIAMERRVANSGSCRPPIPTEVGHSLRSMPATREVS